MKSASAMLEKIIMFFESGRNSTRMKVIEIAIIVIAVVKICLFIRSIKIINS